MEVKNSSWGGEGSKMAALEDLRILGILIYNSLSSVTSGKMYLYMFI